jgi:peptide/nickel transport system ATP-binding protein
MPDQPPILRVENLTVRIRGEGPPTRIVEDVSFVVAPDEVLCVVGESGSGKSVTMLSVMRLLDARLAEYEGRVLFGGEDLLSLSPREMRGVRGAGIAMIFQDPMTALSPVHTVGWQIAEQIAAHQTVSSREARSLVLDLLGQVGISDPERRIDAYPHQLSGGMRQRVMIALALSCRPRLLIADEPTTALDVTIQAQILALITALKESTGMAIVLVTHDMGVVAELADRVQIMYAGRVVEEGTARDVFEVPRHPYTWGLLDSVPRMDRPRPRRLPSIAGAPAAAGQVGDGCVFADRCPHRFDKCDERPTLRDVPGDPGHRAACHLTADRPPFAVVDGDEKR